jgi:LPPG:FO 2-phospho-L-lactate transferase
LIVALAGGTGGAKLARGMLDAAGPDRLTVIANTGDDAEVYGVHVSPDPDLIAYWLADMIDEQRGYGVRDDTWHTMDALADAGHPTWFRLGDRDLATCLMRTEALRAGERLTEATARVAAGLGIRARLVPMTDDPVRTHVRTGGRWLPLQEFLILGHGDWTIEEVELRGVERARPSPEALAAIEAAEAIVIGPSNPVISIGPILAIPGMRAAIERAAAPVVAVSPFVGGRALKGPTEAFCRHAGMGTNADAIAMTYGALLDGIVADEPVERPGVAALVADTLLDSPGRRRALARTTLEFAHTL